MPMLTPSRHTIRVDVKVNAQNAHLLERCVGKYLVDNFQTDVPENTWSTHL